LPGSSAGLRFGLGLSPGKEESEKFGLNLNIQKTKIMATGPITSWQIDGETVETVSDFIFLGSDSVEFNIVYCQSFLGRLVF